MALSGAKWGVPSWLLGTAPAWPPLPGPIATGKRSCPCCFGLPSWLRHPLCHPHDVCHWDLTLRGTGVLAEPPSGLQPLVLPQVGGPSGACTPAAGALCAGVCAVVRPLSVVWPCRPGPALGHTPVVVALCTAGTGHSRWGGREGPACLQFPPHAVQLCSLRENLGP